MGAAKLSELDIKTGNILFYPNDELDGYIQTISGYASDTILMNDGTTQAFSGYKLYTIKNENTANQYLYIEATLSTKSMAFASIALYRTSDDKCMGVYQYNGKIVLGIHHDYYVKFNSTQEVKTSYRKKEAIEHLVADNIANKNNIEEINGNIDDINLDVLGISKAVLTQGSVKLDGSFDTTNIRGYYTTDRQNFTASVPAEYSILAYGNNEGLNNPLNIIAGYAQTISVNTEYSFVVIMAKKNDDSDISLDLQDLVTIEYQDSLNYKVSTHESDIEKHKAEIEKHKAEIDFLDSSTIKADFVYPILQQTGLNVNGVITYTKKRALYYCLNNDIESVSVIKDFEVFIYGNNQGVGHPVTFVSSWSKIKIIDSNFKWLFFVVKKSDDSSLVNVDLKNILCIRYRNNTSDNELYAPLQQTGLNITGVIAYIANRALCYLSSYNIMSISCKDDYECYTYGNNEGVGNTVNTVNSWGSNYAIDTAYKYLFFVVRKSDSSDLVAVDLSDILTIHLKGSLIDRIEGIEPKINSYWTGKKIAYFGTSVPAQGYPQLVGEKLGANLYNQAVGASMMRIGVYNTDDELGDDLGLTGVYFTNALRSMSMTQEERKRLFLCWTTEQRKQWLIENKRYSEEDVANVKGYVEYLGGAFQEDSTDPTTSWPTSKPTDIWAGDGETYKKIRRDSYSYCWNNSDNIEGDLPYSGKITEPIEGRLEPFLSGEKKADLFVFDHFRNDSLGTTEAYLKIPTPTNDRRYPIGAFIYLCQQIYLKVPNAKIAIVGHFDNDDVKAQLGHVWEAQKKASDYFGFPLLELWNKLGIRCSYSVTTTGYWGEDGEWHEDGYNGSNHVWADNSNGALGLNENPRQITINGVLTWVHDLSTRQIWCKDDIHPTGNRALNYFAEVIAAWINGLRL